MWWVITDFNRLEIIGQKNKNKQTKKKTLVHLIKGKLFQTNTIKTINNNTIDTVC